VEGPASATSGRVAVYNGTTGKLLQNGTKLEADLVAGPASATSGRVAVYNGTTGKLLQNGTKAEADLVVGPASATADSVVLFDGTTGKLVKGGGKANADLVVGPASATSGRVAVYNGTTGKLLQDGAKLEADLVVGPASATADAVALYDGTTGKLLKDGPVPGAASGLATLNANQQVNQAPLGSGGLATRPNSLSGFPFGLTYTTNGNLTTASGNTGRVNLLPFLVQHTQLKLRFLAVNLTTAGTADAEIHLGIYKLNQLHPSVTATPTWTLIENGGFAPGNVTGVVEIALTSTLTPGWYATALLIPICTTLPQGTRILAPSTNYLESTTGAINPLMGFVKTSGSELTLPATISGPYNSLQIPGALWLGVDV
jgi:hypothetical protein